MILVFYEMNRRSILVLWFWVYWQLVSSTLIQDKYIYNLIGTYFMVLRYIFRPIQLGSESV